MNKLVPNKETPEGDILYRPVLDQEHIDYQRGFRDSGLEYELVCFYKSDKHMLCNPPDHSKIIDKLSKTLKRTGISKITLTFLDKNHKQ